MFLNMDQLEKQLDKEEFQEIGSMASFKVLETQFQTFIKSRIYLDDESVIMTRKYFLEYTQLEIREFRDTLIQHMTTEEKVDTSNALDASLVDTKSNGTESGEQDTSSKSRNDAHADDADIRPIYDEEPMAEVQLIADHNVFATRQQDTEQPEFNNKERLTRMLNNVMAHVLWQHDQFSKVKSNEAKVKHDIDVIEIINIELEHKVAKLLKENETLKKHYKELYDSIKTTRAKTIEHTTSLIAKNDEFKAQLQEKGFAIAALKNEFRKLKGNSVNTKFAKPSILGKPMKLGRHDKKGRNSEPSVMPSARLQSTTNGSKPKPRINNQKSGNWPASKSSCVTTKTVSIADHSRNSSNFSDCKHFVCSTCHKCVFNANHDACVTKFLNEVNSRAKVPSHKTTNRNKPEKQISITKKPERHIPTGHKFSIKKTSVVHEKTKTPRSCLRWKPTGRILKTVGLRWVPTRKIFTSSTTTVDSEPPHGSNTDITNLYECTPFNLKKERIKAWIKENVISGRPRVMLFSIHSNEWKSFQSQPQTALRSYALSWKPCQGDSLNLPDHMYNIYIVKRSYGTRDPSLETKLQGILLESFQEDAKYEHVGQDTRLQDDKDDKDIQGKDLKISESKTKSKDNDKG
ncbi:hypothetical protein Tco_0149662 [Tanacetum coccineum]